MQVVFHCHPSAPCRRSAIFVTFAWLLYGRLSKVAKAHEDPEAAIALLADVAAAYGIEIVYAKLLFPIKTTHGFIHGRTGSDDSVRTYASLLASEFSRYPKQLVQVSKLSKIVLCEELSFDGQRRNAVPDFEHHTLYLDTKRGDHDRTYQRKVLHHEFYHILDLIDDGELYVDKAWQALNVAEFRYGSGGRNAQDNANTSVLSDRFPGFLNHYSTTGVEEDKAELFANMLVDYQYVNRLAMRDPIMHKKVVAMKALLAKVCWELDDAFWEKVAKGQ